MLLSNGQRISLNSALRSDRNFLHRLKTSDVVRELQESLWSSRATLESICAYHLGLDPSRCAVGDRSTWMRGQFNICVPITATRLDGTCSRVVFRCPIPHKVGSQQNGGEEKVRAEAANYAYVQEECPEIPIAALIGFGFRELHFTHQDYLGILSRTLHCIKRLMFWIRARKAPSHYAPRQGLRFALSTPYLLLDFIEPSRGRMLSDYGLPLLDHDKRRENLYRSLSRLFLSLARRQQRSIGALRFDDTGFIRLVGPPLLCSHVILENETGVQGLSRIYTTMERFIYDLMAFRDRAFRAQPNAAHDEDDCRLQMAHSVLARAVTPQIIDCNAPFALQLTDLHASNIFVDETWNITGVIDLEFMCSLPTVMLSVPYWLAGKYLDGIDAEKHAIVHADFMKIFQSEATASEQGALSRAIQESWESGAYWLYHAITSIDTLPFAVEDRLWPLFGFHPSMEEAETFSNWLSHFWSRDSCSFVAQKVADKERYSRELRQHFDDVK
ncbi:hypothetical protein AC578_3850 [Pseudocercospora eumusae]|uniref:Aminoglycoside phosphotransferase domain-containing protein n=1 Tax=Pseudocercospora eumusae TaxID=321146 RepID=A0A139GWX6_9PEZI|nr:hypothetical protein AC578_3850 [Pseudocercospora eumusae]